MKIVIKFKGTETEGWRKHETTLKLFADCFRFPEILRDNQIFILVGLLLCLPQQFNSFSSTFSFNQPPHDDYFRSLTTQIMIARRSIFFLQRELKRELKINRLEIPSSSRKSEKLENFHSSSLDNHIKWTFSFVCFSVLSAADRILNNSYQQSQINEWSGDDYGNDFNLWTFLLSLPRDLNEALFLMNFLLQILCKLQTGMRFILLQWFFLLKHFSNSEFARRWFTLPNVRHSENLRFNFFTFVTKDSLN